MRLMVLDFQLPGNRFVGRVGTPIVLLTAVAEQQKVSFSQSHPTPDRSLSLCEANQRRVIVNMRPAVGRSGAVYPWGRGMV